ncbi:hypothetical protein [Myroides odoratus]|uniref:hypothetical protein n=1 Tax=Myroides odoratus TaxID=256 RepID=UPI00333EB94B
MEKLNLNEMYTIEGGRSFASDCGIGIGIATVGWSVLGPFALLGLALCIKGDTRESIIT